MATCHPDRPHLALGLCRQCWDKQLRWSKRGEAWRPRGCAGHACDGCRMCVRGYCCRSDDSGYRLPEPGDIPVSYGTLGTIAEDNETQQCHMCGEWFRSLHKHAYHSHDLTPDEYRSAFGLAWRQPLYGPQDRRAYGERLKPWWATDGRMVNEHRPTPEQASAWSSRPERLQVRNRKRPIRERLAREVLANAPRPKTEPRMSECVVCHRSYRLPQSAADRGYKTCGAECRRVWRLSRHRIACPPEAMDEPAPSTLAPSVRKPRPRTGVASNACSVPASVEPPLPHARREESHPSMTASTHPSAPACLPEAMDGREETRP